MQVNKKLLIALALSSALLGMAFGAALVEKMVTTHMRIKPTVMLGIFDVDAVTPLTSIELGDFLHGETKCFPCEYDVPPPETFYANNSDEMPFYLGFWVEDAPPQVSFKVWVRKGNLTTEHTPLDSIQGNLKIYSEIIESSYTNSDPNTQYATWLLSVFVTSTADFGEYTPTLCIGAFETPTG